MVVIVVIMIIIIITIGIILLIVVIITKKFHLVTRDLGLHRQRWLGSEGQRIAVQLGVSENEALFWGPCNKDPAI